MTRVYAILYAIYAIHWDYNDTSNTAEAVDNWILDNVGTFTKIIYSFIHSLSILCNSGAVIEPNTMLEVNVFCNSCNWCSQPSIVNIGAGNPIVYSCIIYWKYVCTY